ncbi:MAG: hypothetical protein WC384_09910 [Prolixibacteraceae bacterium]|jgi:alpha-N-arabinofuranosidase
MRKKYLSHICVSSSKFLFLASVFISFIFCTSFKASHKNPILIQKHLDHNRVNPIKCTGNADLALTKEGYLCAVFLDCRPTNGQFENLEHETLMIPVKWSYNGFSYMAQNEELIPNVL